MKDREFDISEIYDEKIKKSFLSKYICTRCGDTLSYRSNFMKEENIEGATNVS